MKLIEPRVSVEILNKKIGLIKDCETAVRVFLNFYDEFKIKEKLDYPDQDMLLFQYGTYDWDLTGSKFEFNLTRQFEDSDSDEFLQLALTLFFDPNDVKEITDFNSWSIDCNSIDIWQKTIESSEAFKKLRNTTPNRIAVELRET